MKRRWLILAALAMAGCTAERRSVVGHLGAAVYDGRYLGDSGVVFQRGTRDCGLAALTMLSNAELPIALRDSLHAVVSARRRGLSLLEIQDAGKRIGIPLAGYRMNVRSLTAARLPAIAHLFNHFVVVDTIDAGGITIRDPLAGRIRTSMVGFDRLWTGELLVRDRR